MGKLWSRIKQNSWKLSTTVVILAVGVMGATYTYNQHNNELDNLLKASLVAGEILENESSVGEDNQFELRQGAKIPKHVKFSNTGEAPVFMRVSFSETWLGDIEGWLVGEDTYTKLHWTNEWHEEWQLKEDGWYYYKKILPSNTTTAEVLSAVKFVALEELPLTYRNSNYQLTFTMEVVQYSDEVTVNNDALKSAFNRTATVTDGEVRWN